MKEIFINDNQLQQKDIDFTVTRVKALIINSKKEILLAENNNTYQFPGGHLNDNETLQECLKREIKEETGIEVAINSEPFLQLTALYKNYFSTGKNVKCIIYYYAIITDILPDYKKTHYDALETQSAFNLLYLRLKDLEAFLNKTKKEGTTNSIIAQEMLYALKELEMKK